MELTLFEKWLKGLRYSPQTVKQTLVHVRAINQYRLDGISAKSVAVPHRVPHLKRILAVSEEEPEAVPKVLVAFAKEVLSELAKRPHGVRGGRAPKVRKKPARSVDDAAWRKVVAAIRSKDGGPARVLEVQAATGLRIGDILRIDTDALIKSAATGKIELTQKGGKERLLLVAGAPEAWARLTDHCRMAKILTQGRTGRNVAGCVSPSDDTTSAGAAYKRCERVLDEIETELGLDRLHTHRLRRTFAVQALRLTKDVTIVREALGQEPGSRAVEHYIDEARAGETAELSAQIGRVFAGKEKG